MTSVEQKLYDAAEDGRVSDVVSLLRDHPDINVNWIFDRCGVAPLHTASLCGHVEVVKLLLGHPDINVNLKTRYGQPPFSLGCQWGLVSVVRLLLKDPCVDVTLNDNYGRSPLWLASCYGRHEVRKRCLCWKDS